MNATGGPFQKLVRQVHSLPTLPTILLKITELVNNPKTSAIQLGRVIAEDPVLTAKLLKIVNSPFYGFRRRITTITHAIVVLGFNSIKSIVLGSTVFELFKQQSNSGLDRSGFWKHSIACGAASKVVAQRVGYPALEEVFIAGLLHDLGKVVLDQHVHERYSETLQAAAGRNCLLVEVEAELLGVTHAEVGAWLFERWNLSPGLIEATRCHHNPALAGEHAKAVAIVHLADILVRALRCGNGGDARIPPLQESAWNLLRLDSTQFDGLLEGCEQEIQRSMIFLDFIR